MFALRIVCEEVRGKDNRVITCDGDVVFLVDSEWGHTTSHEEWVGDRLITFDTAEAAHKCANKLKPHPWYIRPKSYEVVCVEPVYETKMVGWKVK